eukprot:4124224-Alexandrium_andersonii.AAC.1
MAAPVEVDRPVPDAKDEEAFSDLSAASLQVDPKRTKGLRRPLVSELERVRVAETQPEPTEAKAKSKAKAKAKAAAAKSGLP